MSKIYLIGKASLESFDALKTFNEAAMQLMQQGYEVTNIMYLTGWNELPPPQSLKIRLQLMLDCDAVALLPGYNECYIAIAELACATTAGLTIVTANNVSKPSNLFISVH
jgi:Domain of unknown function (DUF4406)